MVMWVRAVDGTRLNAAHVLRISVAMRQSTGTHYVEARMVNGEAFDLTGSFGTGGEAAAEAREWISAYIGGEVRASAEEWLRENHRTAGS